MIGILNELSAPDAVVVCAAGSLPGDLHKLWRTRKPGGYHLEYGYSTMGYEIAGGLGIRMAQPDRDVYVMVGDGSYLMMAQELVTAVQERVKLTVLVLDNQGFASIGGLSRSVGCGGFVGCFQCLVDRPILGSVCSHGAPSPPEPASQSQRGRKPTRLLIPVR